MPPPTPVAARALTFLRVKGLEQAQSGVGEVKHANTAVFAANLGVK